MTTERITVTRALAELKLLQSRITKSVASGMFVDIYQNRADKAVMSGISMSLFETNAKADLQSITALIERRKTIKIAILLSNSRIMVTVGDKEYTVVEAIERKNSIVFEKEFLLHMRHQMKKMRHSIEQQKPELEKNIMEMLNNNLKTEKNIDSEAFNSIGKTFLEANEYRLLDPCGLQVVIDKLDKDIDEFESEVDFVLSESNAVTKITV